jgi:hypothetical protein
MIIIRRPVEVDEVRSKRDDNTIQNAMEERGYTLGHVGEFAGYRFMEFDGVSALTEQRDYHNGLLADILSIRVPGVLIDIAIQPIAQSM